MKRIWIIATSVLLYSSVAHANFSAADAYRENLAWANDGDLAAMERLIDGRYQIRFGRFGKRTYEPYSATGQQRNVRKFAWHLPAQERE